MTEPSSTGSLWGRIEPIAKMLPLVLAGLYFLGFIIVAFHLAAFGASSLELVRIQYLAAGFWFSLTVAVFEGLTQLWHRLYAHAGHDLFLQKPSIRKWSVVTVALIWAVILWVLPFVSPMRVKNLLQVVRPMLASLLVLDTVIRVRRLVRHSSSIFVNVDDTLARVLPDFFMYIALIMGMVCTVQFSQGVYPKIPFTFGGGQPRQVVFWLGSNNSDSFLERDSASKYSVPYDLLLENENSFVLISPKDGQKVIEIDRKTVNAVIVLGEKRRHLP